MYGSPNYLRRIVPKSYHQNIQGLTHTKNWENHPSPVNWQLNMQKKTQNNETIHIGPPTSNGGLHKCYENKSFGIYITILCMG